jgi:hypothetical protein
MIVDGKEMSLDEYGLWVEGRKAAGQRIDPDTCEACWHHGDILDPYGLYTAVRASTGEPTPETNFGRIYFVRSSEEDGWVALGDLPDDLSSEVVARLRARADAWDQENVVAPTMARMEAAHAYADAEQKAASAA